MREDVMNLLRKLSRPLMLVVIVVVMGIMKPNLFFTTSFFINMLLTISIYGVMICGTIFVVLCGGIDLSIATIAALSGTVVVKYVIENGKTTQSVIIGILLALGVALLIGLVQGLLTVETGLPAMIITLSTKIIISASNQLYIQNKTVVLNEPKLFAFLGGGKFLGIPMPIIWFVLFGILAYIILEHTVLGRQVYVVGGNERAAAFSGINPKRVNLISFMFSALTAGVAGIILASFNQQAVYFAAQGYDGNVLVALVLGGITPGGGGEGKLLDAMFGAVLIGIINRSLILLGVNAVYHDIVRGALIIGAVALAMYNQNRTYGKKEKKS